MCLVESGLEHASCGLRVVVFANLRQRLVAGVLAAIIAGDDRDQVSGEGIHASGLV